MAEVPAALRDTFRDLALGRRAWPLFLTGPVGVGKTCAALALADHVIRVEYMTHHVLTDRYLQSLRPKRPQLDWDALAGGRCHLCVIDEIGVPGTDTPHHYRTLQEVLELREGSPLVLISNLDLEGIEEFFDDRIASRCAAGTVAEYTGRDRRIATA